MATVIDLLRRLGEGHESGGNALAGPIVLPGASDSPLPLPLRAADGPRLIAAWSELTGRQTMGHHALALSAAQTGYTVALMGHGPSPHDDLLLMALAQLQANPQHIGLLIVPGGADALRQRLVRLTDAIGMRPVDAAQTRGRINAARLVIATPLDLHRRVLRYHDRSWRWLWPNLRLIVLPELHRFTGAAAGHLHWLYRRLDRLYAAETGYGPPQLFASLAPVADAEAALRRLQPEDGDEQRPIRVIAAPDGPAHSTLIGLWRTSGDRLETLANLARRLGEHLPVTVLGRDADETRRLRTIMAERDITLADDARVALAIGVPQSNDRRHALLRSGPRLLVLLAGDEPHERLFAAQPDLLLRTLPIWPLATDNAAIAGPHLHCAAAELPIDQREIDRWNVRDLRDRLLRKRSILPLPGIDQWQSAPESADPYAELDPRTIGGPPWTVLMPDGAPLATLSDALRERAALPGQTFAPGLRVDRIDPVTCSVHLAADPSAAYSLICCDTSVTVREEQAGRAMRFGKNSTQLTRGRVVVNQRISELRLMQADGTQRRRQIPQPIERQWSAAACWLSLPADLRIDDAATLGWTLAEALPVIALAAPATLLTSYDAETRRLYVVEVEPGNVGVVAGLYPQFERLLEMARQIADASADRPVLARLVADDRRWLHVIAGTTPARATKPREAAPKPAPVPENWSSKIVQFPGRRDTTQTGQRPATEAPVEERVPLRATGSERPTRRVESLPQRDIRMLPVEPRRPIEQPARPAVESIPEPIQRPPVEPRPASIESMPGTPESARMPSIDEIALRDQPAPSFEDAPIEQAPPSIDEIALRDQPAPSFEDASDRPVVLPDVSTGDLPDPLTPAPASEPESTPTPESAPMIDEDAAPAPEPESAPPIGDEPEPAPEPVIDEPEPAPEPVIDDAPVVLPDITSVADTSIDWDEPLPPEPEPIAARTPTPEPEPPRDIEPRRSWTRTQPSLPSIDDLLPPLPDEQPEESPPAPSRDRREPPRWQARRDPASRSPEARPPLNRDRRPSERRWQPADRQPPNEPRSNQRRSEPDERPSPPPNAAPQERRSEQSRRPDQPSNGARSGERRWQPSSRQNQPPASPPRSSDRTAAPSDRSVPPPDRGRTSSNGDQRWEPRREPSRQPPPDRPAARRAEPEPEPQADVNALIARMRRLREQREAEQRAARPTPSPARPAAPRSSDPVELRFHIGERVQCLPYGTGIVRASRVDDDRELVTIEFPDYGEIEVDSSVSLVRSIGATAAEPSDDPFDDT